MTEERPTMESLDELFKKIEVMAQELNEQVKSNRYFNYKTARMMSDMTPEALKEIYTVTYGADVAEDLERIYQAEKKYLETGNINVFQKGG